MTSDHEMLLERLRAGQLAQAETLARTLTERDPDDAFGWKVLGTLMVRDDRSQDAVSVLEQASRLAPQDAETLNSLARAYQILGRFHEALQLYHDALELQPEFAECWNNQGTAQHALGQHDDALKSYDRALAIQPAYVKALNNRGKLLRELGCVEEALATHDRALAIAPNNAETHSYRGLALQAMERIDEALACYDRALAIHAKMLEKNGTAVLTDRENILFSMINRGNALFSMRRLDDALVDYAKALEFDPDFSIALSNALFVLNYHPDKPAEDIFAAYQDYDRRFGEPHRSSWQAHGNTRDPARRLRVGYVSPDFREHSARHFLEPLLARHDRNEVEITAYAELACEDRVTARYRGYVDHWVATRGLSDAALAERIRADGIDILVEVAGHTASNRLGVFARRPAPVSVSWMGYGYTTGLRAIDYFLCDPVMVPEGSEGLFAEQPWRLAPPSLVYRPDEGMGEPGPLPALSRGYLTFGTLTRSVRINHRTIRVWSAILQQVADARLVIDSKNFATQSMQARLAERFGAHGIGPERLEIGCHSPPWDVLRGIDIGLDCFPHNSGTTLIESLYMGVPFVTLAERPSVGRIGSMILAGAGHAEWIASTEDDYIEKAVALASDLERLATVRASLRGELETGLWRDEAGFARRVEQAYRNMWQHWCATVV
ncbi:tetratricopeptide repeat protein [Allochromatium palmeri]|uniref:protein O-GlcNAc transferase n=1 Tax=Allochromatium palmeri TaxID=231048 RepID=A0A6N8ECM0_9GAMM|nr:glycosyltransferase family 41 protein [Allochromatium palmeri]MTW20639.1 tetratricopeptide repeat protein [Allochromatium palmeri]